MAPVHYHAAPIELSLFLLAVSKGDVALSLKFLELGADVHEAITTSKAFREAHSW